MSTSHEIAFSYEQFESIVKRFALEMPEILLRHQSTAHLALELQRLHLLEAMDVRFTVAIVGQMRVGKSTLLNALIEDDLAPVGVTETTATINWFRHGQGGLCQKFMVHWRDGSTSELPLEMAKDWIGAEENAAKTRCLDFFANTDFLRVANVVDTPGTRSVIQTHETATQGFLAEKLEDETFKYGGSADAVIYAINPVGKESDCDLLQRFGKGTRLPGASAYNSIAVVQKWEHLQPDPLDEVHKKCDILRVQLDGKVSAVIPTSGLMARQAATVPLKFWQNIVDLSTKSTAVALETLLLSDKDFTDECVGAALDAETRQSLLDAVSWKIVPLCIRLAREYNIADGKSLQSKVKEASGIPALRETLQKHFFSRARLIKASTMLRKAWGPCEVALQTLRQAFDEQTRMVRQGHEALQLVTTRCSHDVDLQPMSKYIQDSLRVVERDVTAVTDIQAAVDGLKHRVSRNFELFDADIESLKLVERQRSAFTQKEAIELGKLFGQNGPDLWLRLGIDMGVFTEDAILAQARERFTFWASQKQRSHSDRAKICAHACDVLSLILDHLEA